MMRFVVVMLFLAHVSRAQNVAMGQSWSFVALPTLRQLTDPSFFASPGFTEFGGSGQVVDSSNAATDGLSGLVVEKTSLAGAGIELDPPQPALTDGPQWFVQTKLKVISNEELNGSPVGGVVVQDTGPDGEGRYWMVMVGADGRLCGPDPSCSIESNVGSTTDGYHDLRMAYDRTTNLLSVWWDGVFQFSGTTVYLTGYTPGSVDIKSFASSNNFKFLVHSISASNVYPPWEQNPPKAIGYEAPDFLGGTSTSPWEVFSYTNGNPYVWNTVTPDFGVDPHTGDNYITLSYKASAQGNMGLRVYPRQPKLFGGDWWASFRMKVILSEQHTGLPERVPMASFEVQDDQLRAWSFTFGQNGVGFDWNSSVISRYSADVPVFDTFHDYWIKFDNATQLVSMWQDGVFLFSGEHGEGAFEHKNPGFSAPGVIRFYKVSNSFKYEVQLARVAFSNVGAPWQEQKISYFAPQSPTVVPGWINYNSTNSGGWTSEVKPPEFGFDAVNNVDYLTVSAFGASKHTGGLQLNPPRPDLMQGDFVVSFDVQVVSNDMHPSGALPVGGFSFNDQLHRYWYVGLGTDFVSLGYRARTADLVTTETRALSWHYVNMTQGWHSVRVFRDYSADTVLVFVDDEFAMARGHVCTDSQVDCTIATNPAYTVGAMEFGKITNWNSYEIRLANVVLLSGQGAAPLSLSNAYAGLNVAQKAEFIQLVDLSCSATTRSMARWCMLRSQF